MDYSLAEVQDKEILLNTIGSVRDIVTKDYLYRLEQFEVAEIPEELKQLEIADVTRIFKFKRMVSDNKESVIDKLVTVLNAAYSNEATVIALISGHEKYTEYYLGVVCKDISQERYNITTQGMALKGTLAGNFPGLEMEAVRGDSKKELLNNIFVYDCVTAISGIASIRNEKDHSYEKFVQGIEHLVDSLLGREYNVVVIADPINSERLSAAKLGYETLYTNLSPFAKTSVSFNESESITLTQSHTQGITKTIGESTSLTQNYSQTSGWSESHSYGASESKDNGQLAGLLVGAAAGVAAIALTGGAAAPIVAAAMAGEFVGGKLGSGLIGTRSESNNETNTISGNTTQSSGQTTSKNQSEATQNSNTQSGSQASTQGKTIQLTNENKNVKNLLETIEKHIERIKKCESYGAFNCAAYVISSDPETNAIVSSGYNALMRGDNSALQASYINSWNFSKGNGKRIKEYLKKFSHPLFIDPAQEALLSTASIANSYELAVSLGFPKKSINGLPVFEMASFGRNVYNADKSSTKNNQISLGNISHMGAEQNIPVALDVKSLAMHTFVTGSTGSGKSNTVYQMLRELRTKGVHFMVVEPAKGEYKNVFGDGEVSVFGTNPYITPLLRLNPFCFPEGIHVLEHIDRLVEIFNVCWPMYAAMPAVLKDAVERAYRNAGWDLETSENRYSSKLFPSFIDILKELNSVVDESAFSQEVKDNYIGSLATRVKSLTNGIYGRIFDTNELGDERLFDNNVIVDLSRVGSIETKALLMGVLVMRLQEYRMTSGEMDSDLRHVTVLEEAHNLLKRTSTDQSSESSNLLGKSVEMLSNAIAEMRTYGEGFIIADQAPELLDMSVIRNTNTKIIMRLPDAQDRELVGKSANLTELQIRELAKLPTGVAAVYQNNWLEPVLCKVKYEQTGSVYRNEKEQDILKEVPKTLLIKRLVDKVAGERFDINMQELLDEIVNSAIPSIQKIDLIKIMKRNGKVDWPEISSTVYDLVCTPEMEREANDAESIEDWRNTLVYAEDSILQDLGENEQNHIVECILREQIIRYDKPEDYLTTWDRFLKGEVI